MDNHPDKEAFLQLIETNKGIIFKICNTYCTNAHDREDLAQEIIYQLWRSSGTFDPAYRFSTWMYRVALNVAISFYRKVKASHEKIELTEELPLIAENTNTEKEENIHLLQQFISELKELDRALMILYLDGRSYSEIAEVLGITETNVATKTSRIKEKLKQKFASHQ
ncbi:MAG: sigma-70 family RNA polymerase sigma factor [Filimonas sp.]|nr:sigma-70 family RNA polymerase sigma factor [Filimonas sp.]